MRYLVLAILIVIKLSQLHSQSLQYQSISAEDGLVFGYNDHMLRRSNGTLWISSDNGIYEYNGIKLRHYSESNTPSFKGEIVLSEFYETNYGDILIATDKGILKYDSQNGVFSTIVEGYPNFNNEYYLIDLMDEKDLIARLGDSIHMVNLELRNLKPIAKTQSVRFDHKRINDKHVIAGCPWIQKPGIELYFIESDSIVRTDSITFEIPLDNLSVQPEFSGVVIQNDHILWAVSEHGLFEIDYTESKEFQIYTPQSVDKPAFISIELTSDSTIWVTSTDEGIWKFNLKKKKFTDHKTIQNGLASNQTRQIYIDSQEYQWVSSLNSGQISYGKDRDIGFKQYATFKMFDTESPINFIYEESATLRAFSADGIIIIDEEENIEFTKYRTIENKFVDIKSLYSVGAADSIGQYWLGSEDKIYKIKNDLLQEHLVLPDSRILYFDQYDENQAVIFTNSNIGALDLTSGQIQNFKLNGLSINPLEITRVLESNGRYFIVYNDRHLYELSLDSGSLVSDSPIICQSSIFSVTATTDQLYICTSYGIEIAGPDSTHEIHRPEFINTGSFNKLFITDKSDFIISTSKGLLSVDKSFKDWLLFTKNDGLLSDQFIMNTGILGRDGQYYIPTQTGITKFDKEATLRTLDKPDIHLNDLSINNHTYKRELLIQDSLFELKPFETSISITPTCVSFQAQENNQLFYRINSEDSWKKITNGDDLSLRLSSGSYLIQFIGSNANGVLSDISSIRLNIALPFWRTITFFITSLVGAGLLIFFIARTYYQNKIKKEEERFAQERLMAAQLENERNRIASEMHDELGGGLTSIRLLSQKMLSNKNKKQDQYGLEKVAKYSTQLVDNMHSIVWSMDSAHNSLIETTTYLQHYIDDILENGGIEGIYNIEIANPDLTLTTTIRRNLYLVIKEAMTNILKHSQATQVKTTILQQETLMIEIADNGIGLGDRNSNGLGNGLRNIKKRIEDLNGELVITSTENGTCIKITLKLNL